MDINKLVKRDYYKDFKKQREERLSQKLEQNEIYETENQLPVDRWDTNIIERGYLKAHNLVEKIKGIIPVLTLIGGLMTNKNKGLAKIITSVLSAIGMALSTFGIITLPDEFWQYIAEGGILFYSAFLAYKGTKEVKDSKKEEGK